MKSYQKSIPLLLYNARLITQNKVMNNSWVFIKDGKIFKYGAGKPYLLQKGAKRIDARGCYLTAGFIDLHIHGEESRISKQQVKYGTTSFLKSLHAQSYKQLGENASGTNIKMLDGAQCLGVHLEGPFINREMAGAQPKKSIKNPDLKAMRVLIEKSKNKIKIVTIAPELKNSLGLIKLLKKNKITSALGHSNASIEQAKRAVDAGADYATHVFNRMSGISSRNPGLIAQVLMDERITAGVIADGHHVHPANLKLLIKNKPVGKIVLVTDSVAAMNDKSLKIIAGVYKQENFVIAGSRLTLLRAIRNMIYLSGVSITDAVSMATANPARILGIARKKGRIAKGYDADIVIFDKDFRCRMTIVNGTIVYKKGIK